MSRGPCASARPRSAVANRIGRAALELRPVRAVVVEKTGGPEALQVVERPVPEPGPGQVVIDVACVGYLFY